MALRIEGPGDVRGIDAIGFAPSGGGSGAHAPTWGVSNPVAVAMSGLQKAAEQFADTYDDVQVNDYLMKKVKEMDERYNNPETGLFNTRKRGDAQGLYQEEKEYQSKIWDEDAPKYLSERQLRMASKPFGALFRNQARLVASHETSELMSHQVDMAENSIFAAQNLVASGNLTEDKLGVAMNSINIATQNLGRMQGWDAETTERKKQEAWGKAVLKGAVALAATNPMAALGFLKENQSSIPAEEFAGVMAAVDGKAQDKHIADIKALVLAGDMKGARKLMSANSAVGSVPRGIRNNNPGNIVRTNDDWEGEVAGQDGKFKAFATPEHGIAAIGRNLLSYASKGLNTVSGIISRWAPPSENNTSQYISIVSKALGVPPDAKLDMKDPAVLAALTRAIIQHENRQQMPYSDEQIQVGVDAALGKRKISTVAGAVQQPQAGAGGGDSTNYVPGTGMLSPSKALEMENWFAQQEKKQRTTQLEAYGRNLAQDILDGKENATSVYERLGQEMSLTDRDSVWTAIQSEVTNKKQTEESARDAASLRLVAEAKEFANSPDLTIESVSDFLSSKVGRESKEYPYIEKVLRTALVRQGKLPFEGDITHPVSKMKARAAVLAGQDFAMVEMEYGKEISSVDLEELKVLSMDEGAKKANRKAAAFWDEMVLKSGLNVNGSGANEEDKLYLAQKKVEFEDMVANNEFKSRDDQKAWIYGTLAKRTKPGMIWDSSYTPREAQGRAGTYVPVPDYELPAIERELHSSGVPVTEENIQKMYNEKLQERGR